MRILSNLLFPALAMVGSVIMWVSTNSIPETIQNADGFIETNLRYLGVENPPDEIASFAADNAVYYFGIALLIVGVVGIICLLLYKCRNSNKVEKMDELKHFSQHHHGIGDNSMRFGNDEKR